MFNRKKDRAASLTVAPLLRILGMNKNERNAPREGGTTTAFLKYQSSARRWSERTDPVHFYVALQRYFLSATLILFPEMARENGIKIGDISSIDTNFSKEITGKMLLSNLDVHLEAIKLITGEKLIIVPAQETTIGKAIESFELSPFDTSKEE